MKLRIDRAWKKDTYTISRLYVDGQRYYEALEDRDRGLRKEMPLSQIKAIKVYAETAIPAGTYKITMAVKSPKYSAKAAYSYTGGYMPRLLDVPGFDGILMHCGADATDSAGCLLIGRNTQKGRLTQSQATFRPLWQRMKAAADRGEEITIQIG